MLYILVYLIFNICTFNVKNQKVFFDVLVVINYNTLVPSYICA